MIVYHVTYDLCRNTAGVNWVCLIHGLSGLIKWDFCLFTFMVMWLLSVSFLIFISGSHQPHHGTLSGLMIQHEEAWPPNPPHPVFIWIVPLAPTLRRTLPSWDGVMTTSTAKDQSGVFCLYSSPLMRLKSPLHSLTSAVHECTIRHTFCWLNSSAPWWANLSTCSKLTSEWFRHWFWSKDQRWFEGMFPYKPLLMF